MFNVKEALCIDTHHRFLVHDEVYAEWIGIHHDCCVSQSHGHTATAAQHHMQTGTDNTPKWEQSQTQRDHTTRKPGQTIHPSENSLRLRETTLYANWNRQYRQVRTVSDSERSHYTQTGTDNTPKWEQSKTQRDHTICKLEQTIHPSENSLRLRETTLYANWDRQYTQVRTV